METVMSFIICLIAQNKIGTLKYDALSSITKLLTNLVCTSVIIIHNFQSSIVTVMPEPGGARGATGPPQYLADQLTLFQPREGILSLILLVPPKKFHLPASLGNVTKSLSVFGRASGRTPGQNGFYFFYHCKKLFLLCAWVCKELVLKSQYLEVCFHISSFSILKSLQPSCLNGHFFYQERRKFLFCLSISRSMQGKG